MTSDHEVYTVLLIILFGLLTMFLFAPERSE